MNILIFLIVNLISLRVIVSISLFDIVNKIQKQAGTDLDKFVFQA